MKRQTKFQVLVMAAALAPLAAAYAEEENFISTAETGYFQRMAAMPRTVADRALKPGMHVIRTPLLWEIVTYDAPAPGAQGPIREEFNPEATAARETEQQQIWDQMYPIGGEDTP